MTRLVRVALLQLQAFDRADAAQGLDHMLAMIDRAAEQRPHVMVLPEVSYPAYFMGSNQAEGEAPVPRVIDILRERAARHQTLLVAGIAEPGPGCTLNAAVMIGPDGNVFGSQGKRFLWHFDRRWFTPATRSQVFQTAVGPVGIIICADGRMPEITRELALAGATLILDSTAWVTTGADPTKLSNPQVDYMLAARARENGVWIAAANKVGLEAGSVLYCGRSGVFAPDGSVAAQAGSAEAEIITAEIDLDAASGPPVAPRLDLYAPVARPIAEQPIAALLDEPLVPSANRLRVAACQQPLGVAPADLDHLFQALALQDVELALLSPLTGRRDEILPPLARSAQAAGLRLVVPILADDGGLSLHLLDDGAVAFSYEQTHGTGARGDRLSPVITIGAVRVGLMAGGDGWAPEVARTLMLQGADLLLWAAANPSDVAGYLARTRADENKVYLVLAVPAELDADLTTTIFAPSGAPLATALRGQAHAVAASVDVVATRLKEMAPGTNVVLDRQPESFGQFLVATPLQAAGRTEFGA